MAVDRDRPTPVVSASVSARIVSGPVAGPAPSASTAEGVPRSIVTTSPRSRRRRSRGRPPSDPRGRSSASAARGSATSRRAWNVPSACSVTEMSAKSSHHRVDGKQALYTASLAQKRMRSQCRSGSAAASARSLRPFLVPQRRGRVPGQGARACGSASMPMPRSRSDRATTAARYPAQWVMLPTTPAGHRGTPSASGRIGVGGSPIRRSALPGAVAHSGELEATPRRRVCDDRCLNRKHRRLRDVGIQIGARRCRDQRFDHRRGLRAKKSGASRVEVGASHLHDDGSRLRPTLIHQRPRGLCVRTPAAHPVEPTATTATVIQGQPENVKSACEADCVVRRRATPSCSGHPK